MRNKNNRRSRRRKWPVLLLSIAICAIAGGGMGYLIFDAFTANFADPLAAGDAAVGVVASVDGPEQTMVFNAQELPTESALPTASPTPTPSPSPTPEPTPTPVPTPTPGPLDGLKIGIDPGHQAKGNNDKEPVAPGSKEKKPKVSSGTSGVKTKTPEHVRDLEISMRLRDLLESLGAEVKMTRETADVDISNVERAEMMNEWGADLVLRIHCNGADKKKPNGIGLYIKTKGEGAKESMEAAELILPAMVEATGAKKDGLFKRDIYSGLNWSTVPSILVECGYMSNPDEDVKLAEPEYQWKLSEGMVRGLALFFQRELPEQIEIPEAAEAPESEEEEPAEGTENE